MPDYLARLREEADRRLDPRDAAALQREIADHLAAATAAYEEVGEPDARARAEAALGAPDRLVRGVARALAPRGAARQGFAGTAAFCLFFVFLLVGLQSDSFPRPYLPTVLAGWSPLLFAPLLLRAGQRGFGRAVLGAVAGACVGYAVLVGAYATLAHPYVAGEGRVVFSFAPDREIAQERRMIEFYREDPAREVRGGSVRRSQERVRELRRAASAPPAERIAGAFALAPEIAVPLAVLWATLAAGLGALSRRVRRPRRGKRV